MDKIKVMTIFGTRPEAIKMAPLVQELAAPPGDREPGAASPPSTGRCWTPCWRFLRSSPSSIWTSWSRRQTLSTITTKCLAGHGDGHLSRLKPDLVLVHGDTSTTFAGALAAFYHQVPVGHVEAGLRTWDKYSPFPEEMNRTLVGRLADLHFCPTEAQPPESGGGGHREGRVRHGQYRHRRAQDHRAAGLHASPRRPSISWTTSIRRLSSSPATGGRTTVSPWRTSCPRWRRSGAGIQ